VGSFEAIGTFAAGRLVKTALIVKCFAVCDYSQLRRFYVG
jgi:hypothetical protein